MRYLIPFGLALLWGLFPAQAQNLPPGSQGAACLASLNAPSYIANMWAPLSCDLFGNLRTSGGGGGGGGQTLKTTTTGALEPPTAAAGKIVATSVTLAANTSTQLVAANDQRIVVEIQCDGTAVVGVSRTGAALTSATAAPLVIPAGSYPLYTMPMATLTAITAYTGTGQTCRVTEYLR